MSFSTSNDATNLMCPILTGVTYTDASYTKCKSTICAMWDAQGGPEHKGACGINSQNMHALSRHTHNRHRHVSPFMHQANNLDPTPYGLFLDSMQVTMPVASLLANSYVMQQSMTSDNKIYGNDFMIADSTVGESPRKPTILSQLESDPDWQDPNTKIRWQDYLAGYTNPPYMSTINPNYGALAGSTSVSIYGGNFSLPLTVTYADMTATSLTVVDSTHLTMLTPASDSSQVVNVKIFNNTYSVTLSGVYTYTDIP